MSRYNNKPQISEVAPGRGFVRGAFGAMLILCAALGCAKEVPPEPPGGMTVSWRVSPLGCEASGVSEVVVETIGTTEIPREKRSFSCLQGRGVMEGFAPGHYTVQLTGLDEKGNAIFSSVPLQVGVSSQTLTPIPSMRLTARVSSLDVRWFFDNGRLCSSNNVKEVFVGVYDEDAYVMDERVFPCNTGGGMVEDLLSGTFLVEILGLAADGSFAFRGFELVDISRGDHAQLEVELQVCSDAQGC